MVDHADIRSVALQARRLTDNPAANSLLLGCFGCAQFRQCGGLNVQAEIFDCLALCCGNEKNCTQVCPNAVDRFIEQTQEVGGFGLHSVPSTPVLNYRTRDEVAELIYHGSKRATPLMADIAALRLADLVDFRKGTAKYLNRDQICDAFKLSKSTRLIISGVDHDNRIEPWWTLGAARLPIIETFRILGIELVTASNFSVLLDVPRADNLHAMKRIAIVFAEFQRAGIPCALHPNGRTERDFVRWAEFIAGRPEIEIISYEFITGPGLKARRLFHFEMLGMLAKTAGRPLDLVVRGDPHIIPALRPHFRNVIYIDTTAFVKTMKRREAERLKNRLLVWKAAPTSSGELLDNRLQHNVDEQVAYIRNVFYDAHIVQSQAA